MVVQLVVDCPERAEEYLHPLVRELATELNALPSFDAAQQEALAPPRSKAVEALLASILITVLKEVSGPAVSSLLGAFFNREPALKLTFKFPNGEVLEIDSKGLKASEVERLARMLEKTIRKKP